MNQLWCSACKQDTVKRKFPAVSSCTMPSGCLPWRNLTARGILPVVDRNGEGEVSHNSPEWSILQDIYQPVALLARTKNRRVDMESEEAAAS